MPAAASAGQHRSRAVDVVGAPAAEPGAAGLLFGQQPVDSAPGARIVRPADICEHFDDMGGDVGRRRVDDLAEVAERQAVGERAGVVGVEGAPGSVPGLHAEGPAHRPADRRLDAPGVGMGDAAQRQHHLGGVVDVRVVVVLELERPATGAESGSAHLPVPGAVDLLGQYPVGRLDQLRVVGRQSGVGEGDGGQAGVPYRGLARLDHPHGRAVGLVLAPDGEAVQ